MRNKFLVVTKAKAICSTLNKNRNASQISTNPLYSKKYNHTFYQKSMHIGTHLVRLFFPVNPTCIKKNEDSFHQCKAYFPNQLTTDITVDDD